MYVLDENYKFIFLYFIILQRIRWETRYNLLFIVKYTDDLNASD